MKSRVAEAIGAPVGASALVLLVGAAGVLSREPWLIPSLGATAMFVAVDPVNPSCRPYAILLGHLTALVTGLLSLWVCNAWWEPALLTTGNLTTARLCSAVLAVAWTTVLSSAINAVHPPAGATALLVTLGSLQSGAGVLSLATGAALVSALSAPLRWIRLSTSNHGRRFSAARSVASPPGTKSDPGDRAR